MAPVLDSPVPVRAGWTSVRHWHHHLDDRRHRLGRHAPSVVVNVATAASLPIPPPVASPAAMARHTIRQEVESLAAINAVGGCGWCGSPSAHLNDSGYLVHPRHWHAAEIEERIRSKTLP
jgi:hypothetical protein